MTDFSSTREVCSSKPRRCCLCRHPIKAGAKHILNAGKYDGDFYTQRAHAVCWSKTAEWEEDDWLYHEPREFCNHELGMKVDG